jgi:CRP/FNR family transcriptional regulator, cyclic AMP receptor protein
MLTIEKIFLLKSLDIFAQVPEKDLMPIATLLEEVILPKGTDLFLAGDEGDAMYIILEGKIRIHAQGNTFAELGDKSHFGELSLLDSDTRSANATSIENTRLFRLRQGPFFEVLSEHFSIAHGIIRILCQRLRKQNDETLQLKKLLETQKD